MRALLILLLALVPAAALGEEWGRYNNERYIYRIEVPPSFEAMGESDSGDGQVFRGGFGTQVLTVFGANVTEADFEQEIAWRKSTDPDLAITYEVTTPSWATWSGERGDRIFYAHAIALCGGSRYAMFTLEYFAIDRSELDPQIDQLSRSLRYDSAAAC